MTDALSLLAATHGLEDRTGTSPDGLSERYVYSPEMDYRYAFGRWWGQPDLATTDVWVLLNPATGDTEMRRRPTLERCISRSRAAGSTGLLILNLFAFRHTKPTELSTVLDPVGPANDEALRVLTSAAPRTIAAWGGSGGALGSSRSRQVRSLLVRPLCLGTTRFGEPRHPLYVPVGTALTPWTMPPEREAWSPDITGQG